MARPFPMVMTNAMRNISGQCEEIVLGYDAKEMWLPPSISWDKERRRVYLLKEDVDKPLSVDLAVWSSIYDGECDGVRWLHPVIPDGLDIWGSLIEMEASIDEFGVENLGEFWKVAITCVGDACDTLDWRPSDAKRTSPKSEWEFLGYDVADGAFTSGLSNCGYLQGEEKYTGNELNEYHLFASAEAAFRFKDYSDQRVQEHKPFYVYGLYRIGGNGNASH